MTCRRQTQDVVIGQQSCKPAGIKVGSGKPVITMPQANKCDASDQVSGMARKQSPGQGRIDDCDMSDPVVCIRCSPRLRREQGNIDPGQGKFLTGGGASPIFLAEGRETIKVIAQSSHGECCPAAIGKTGRHDAVRIHVRDDFRIGKDPIEQECEILNPSPVIEQIDAGVKKATVPWLPEEGSRAQARRCRIRRSISSRCPNAGRCVSRMLPTAGWPCTGTVFISCERYWNAWHRSRSHGNDGHRLDVRPDPRRHP